jgi:hypothetical protein
MQPDGCLSFRQPATYQVTGSRRSPEPKGLAMVDILHRVGISALAASVYEPISTWG